MCATFYSGEIPEGFWVEPSDMVVGMDGDFNCRLWPSERGLLNQRVCKLTPREDFLEKKFLSYALPGYLRLINEHTHSITVKHLSSKTISEIPFPLPPRAEQRRIVSKLDSLFERTRRAREELSHVPRLIENFKNGILEAAFFQAQQASESDRNISLGELAVEVRNGLSKRPADSPPGTPILRISAVRPMAVNLLDRRFYPTDEELSDRVFLEEEDLLFTRYNGNPDFVAVCGKVTNLFEPTTYPDKLIRVRLSGDILPSYAELICSTPQAREALRSFIKTAAGQHGISGKDLKKLKIPVPTLDTQEKINAKAREQLSGISEVANQANLAGHLLDHLDRANLAKAFRGELVPQDPNDEPASVLLERICAARAQQGKNTRKGRGKTANARVAA
jgi:type I restriction enzyme S subunit